MIGDKDYKKKIRQASNAYLKYLDHIRELESMANNIIKDSHLYEYIDGPITCERFPDSGLSFIIELYNDGGMPRTVRCISFFELFKNGPEYVTVENLKKISF